MNTLQHDTYDLLNYILNQAQDISYSIHKWHYNHMSFQMSSHKYLNYITYRYETGDHIHDRGGVLWTAAECGYLECLRYATDKYGLGECSKSDLLGSAACGGHIECFKYIYDNIHEDECIYVEHMVQQMVLSKRGEYLECFQMVLDMMSQTETRQFARLYKADPIYKLMALEQGYTSYVMEMDRRFL